MIDPTYVKTWSRREGNNDAINVLKFSPTGSEDGLIAIYGVHDGEVLHRIQMHSAVISLAWDLSHQCGLYCGCQNSVFYFKDFENTGSEILTGLREAPGYAIEVSMMGMTLALAVGPEIHIARHFATTNILPKPSHPQNLSDSDDCIRGHSLHFIKNDTKLIISYLNHGILLGPERIIKALDNKPHFLSYWVLVTVSRQ
ncbi:hypothetical protein BDQ17DRAFT_1434932 [Cyathus striatus]|nr:hypothetical protein BDQ17DRAFT_1434932 [Cyathus striatus]